MLDALKLANTKFSCTSVSYLCCKQSIREYITEYIMDWVTFDNFWRKQYFEATGQSQRLKPKIKLSNPAKLA
jgi:hypothetical protein